MSFTALAIKNRSKSNLNEDSKKQICINIMQRIYENDFETFWYIIFLVKYASLMYRITQIDPDSQTDFILQSWFKLLLLINNCSLLLM